MDWSKRILFTLWMCFENRLNCKDCTHANPLRGHSEFTGYALHFVNNLKESSIMVRSIVSIAAEDGPQKLPTDVSGLNSNGFVHFMNKIYPLIFGGYSEDWIQGSSYEGKLEVVTFFNMLWTQAKIDSWNIFRWSGTAPDWIQGWSARWAPMRADQTIQDPPTPSLYRFFHCFCFVKP